MPRTAPSTPAKKKAPVHKPAAVKKEKDAPVVAAVAPAPSAAHKGDVVRGLGRRKEAVAQVRITAHGKGACTVNGRDWKEYFPTAVLQTIVDGPQRALGMDKNTDVSAVVKGGGIRGQAEAVRLGIARALLATNEDYRKTLRAAGFLTRDARVKERKKYGLKRARRAPQFSKR